MAEAIVASLIKECIRSIRSQMKTEGRSIQHIYRRNGQTETESVNIDDANAYVVTPRRKLQTDELTTVNLYRENAPSVVSITSIAVRQDPFTLDVLEVPQGSGTGFIWDEKGHIVTNYHVIQGASNLRVELDDQSVYEAKVIGYDQDTDVAILGIDAPKKLRPVPVGSSRDLLVGQKVYAIGNPDTWARV